MYNNIKTVLIDVDGTLTNGIYQISSASDITKSFYTRDFYGIEQMLKDGLAVIIITQSKDFIIMKQIERICEQSIFWRKKFDSGWLQIWDGIDDKYRDIEIHIGVGQWENIAYIGDAENDLPCIISAAFSGCPSDAIPEVKDNALFVCDNSGGRGAVYEFAMHLLKCRNGEK
jgi:3-deoxy-D-manno-octulosonate 8-phosphate phosphatase (KDO 8-P phosphatase)